MNSLRLGLILALSAISAASAATDGEQTALQLIQAATADAVESYGGQALKAEEQKEKLETLLHRYGDKRAYAEDSLGRYWEKASLDDKAGFSSLLDRFMIESWFSQLNGISPALRIDIATSEQQDDGRIIVHSLAIIPTDSFAVDWTIGQAADGHPIIADIAVDGVSLLQTMKSDFQAYLRTHDGRLATLAAALNGKMTEYGH